jgi:uncharacterized protein (DUF1778 family)
MNATSDLFGSCTWLGPCGRTHSRTGVAWSNQLSMAISDRQKNLSVRYGEMPYSDCRSSVLAMALASDRLDLKLSSDDKDLLIQAAALEGMSLAAFVRSAAKKQASEAILRDRQLQLSQRDFDAFHAAIHEPFRATPPLEEALQRVRTQVRRA